MIALAIAILIAWAILAFVVNVGGGLIHLILLAALAVLIYHFIRNRRHTTV